MRKCIRTAAALLLALALAAGLFGCSKLAPIVSGGDKPHTTEPAATGSQTDTEDTQNMENAEDTGEQDWAGEEESSDPAPVETDPPVWEGPETVVYLAPYDALAVEYGGYFYDWKNMLKYGCLIAGVVLAGIGWWFIRSYIVLDGDLLGLATREKMAIQYAVESVNPLTMQTYQSMGYTVLEMFRERYTLSGLFHSFVAAFGSMSIYGSIWLYRAYKAFFVLGTAGSLLYVICYKKRRKISGREWFFHINMLYCIFMPVFLTIYYAYTTDYQNQGRYLLPALLPLMYYMIKGIQKLSELKIKGRTFPRWLVNTGVAICFLILVGGTIDMVYVRALPVYLETGLVLK